MKFESKSRHLLIICFAGILGAVLCVRLFALTVIDKQKWTSYAEDISLRAVYETAPRGDILDRNGEVIAASKAVYSVNISRINLTEEKAFENAAAVIDILKENDEDVEITQSEIKKSLSDTGYNAYMPITISKNVSSETAEKIKAENYPGVQIAVNYIRDYPQGELASHVIGYLGRISKEEEESYVEEKGYRKDALIGKSGIEKEFEETLRGKDSVSSLQVDSSGKVTKLLSKSRAVKGEDLKLTIDMDIQKTAEESLEKAIKQASLGGTFESEYGDYQMSKAEKAAVGSAVVLDVKTGEVLALANFPDFDPNDFAVSISNEKWEALQRENKNDPLSPAPLYNVATMTAVQPGSTFKPVTAMAALSCGLDKDRYLYDDGYIELGNRRYGCFLWNEKEEKHGYVNLTDALRVSCNYYFYDIASGKDFASGTSLNYNKKIDNGVILSYAKKMGLGEKSGIEIPESSGVLPTEKLKNDGIKSSLKSHLMSERETYFIKSFIENEYKLTDLIEKITNWCNQDLTLEEIIGKLKREKAVKEDMVDELARVCKYDYFNQSGWTQGDTFNISIGQGDNAYTTLQMANYMATMGNGGVRNRVSLVLGSSEKRGEDSSSSDKENMEYLIDAMTEVTKGDGGSLQRAFADFPYDVAAKTGTAQRSGYISTEDESDYIRRHLHLIAPDLTYSQVEKEAKRLMEEYPESYENEDKAVRRAVINLSKRDLTYDNLDAYKEKYDAFAWTVALAPADEPQIAVAVMLVQGKTSSNAAPIVREIIGKYGENKGWEKSF